MTSIRNLRLWTLTALLALSLCLASCGGGGGGGDAGNPPSSQSSNWGQLQWGAGTWSD